MSIEEDYKEFRDIYGGRIREDLKKRTKEGSIFKLRPDGRGFLPVRVPEIDLPEIIYGERQNTGIANGEGKDGTIIQKGNQKGKGKGRRAGEDAGEGQLVNLDLGEIVDFLQNDLALPDLKPKQQAPLEQQEVKYNSISLTGPNSLRHTRRTLLQSIRRQCAADDEEMILLPGHSHPVPAVDINESDFRYRQYKIIKKPSTNAVIFFARDGSGSMDEKKCEMVSNLCWWLDVWIRRFYKRVERFYCWHDVYAKEVDEDTFYRLREGGGTKCSSALQLISEQFENRFPPAKWNIYVFYFTDGENWGEDNRIFCDLLKYKFAPNIVNLFGLVQVMATNWGDPAPMWGGGYETIKDYVDKFVEKDNITNIRTTSCPNGEDVELRNALIDILGKNKAPQKTKAGG